MIRPFLFLIVFLISKVICDLSQSDINILWDLYNATNGENWEWAPSDEGRIWDFEIAFVEPCNQHWQGIVCNNDNNELLNLTLQGYNLNGSLPSSLGNLSQLIVLDLPNNNLISTIPSSLGYLSQLEELSLNYNHFSGSIPSSLGKLSELRQLLLYHNRLTGTFPSSLANLFQLKKLLLYFNILTGPVPTNLGNLSVIESLFLDANELSGSIPDTLGELRQLQALYLDANFLSGTIPTSLCRLSQLLDFYLYNNKLTGTIPECIRDLSILENLVFFNNKLTGSIPASLGYLTQLQQLYLYNNKLSGSIASNLEGLAQLQYFIVNYNVLSGIIPDSLCNLSQLLVLNLYQNYISGTIPSSLNVLTKIQELDLHLNYLFGSIPSSFGELSSLQHLYLQQNFLSGTVPSTIGNLVNLQQININVNLISGSIPSSLGKLSQLNQIDFSFCFLSGTIPWSLEDITQLQELNLYLNYLTGSIPLSLGNLFDLQQMYLNSNQLTGTIPSSLGSLLQLQYLILDDNKLFGTIPSTLSNLINLYGVDLSFNQFSGQLNSSLFVNSNVKSLVLSSNCFTGSISSSLCKVSSLQALVLSGYNAGMGCTSKVLSNDKIRIRHHDLVGDLPECIFNQMNLSTLYADSIGWGGQLPSVLLSSSLLNVSLSHNYLRGDIPMTWRNSSLWLLDLSHNLLDGSLNGMQFENYNSFAVVNDSYKTGSVLNLDVNRFSGPIPLQLINHVFGSLNILNGNIFGCASIPEQDVDSAKYQCGSEVLGAVIYTWLSVLIIGLLSGLCFMYFNPDATALLYQYLQFLYRNAGKASDNAVVYLIHNEMASYRTMVLKLSMFLLVLCLPAFCLLKMRYATHSYEYGWYPSLVYMEGLCPMVVIVSLFVLLWMFVLRQLYTHYHWNPVVDINDKVSSHLKYMDLFGVKWYESSNHFYSAAIIFINMMIVLFVNGVYIYSLLYLGPLWQNLSYIALVLFKIIWSSIMLNLLSNESVVERLMVMVLNIIIIPLIGTTVVDPDCFFNLFSAPSSITGEYFMQHCFLYLVYPSGETVCALFVPTFESFEFIPTFAYSYQCSSSLIVSYVPVFLSMCTIMGVVIPLVQLFCIHLFQNRGVKISAFWRAKLDQIVYISQFFPVDEDSIDSIAYGAEEWCVTSSVFLLLLIIFGFSYPLLSLMILMMIVFSGLVIDLCIARHWDMMQNKVIVLRQKWESRVVEEFKNFKLILYASIPLYFWVHGILLSLLLVDYGAGVFWVLGFSLLILIFSLLVFYQYSRRKSEIGGGGAATGVAKVSCRESVDEGRPTVELEGSLNLMHDESIFDN